MTCHLARLSRASLVWTVAAFGINVMAQTVPSPQTPAPATQGIDALVPTGWKIVQKAEGDLNNDGRSDVALIIENTDPANIKANDGLGVPSLNLNPRHLIVAFQNKDKAYDVQTTQKQFIPSANSAESPCLQDPLAEAEPMNIKNGTLRINMRYWLSCGSYFVSEDRFVFRYNGSNFNLIGYDSSSFSRASGEIKEQSRNYSTGKMSITTGGNMFTDHSDKPRTRWQSFSSQRFFTLDDMPQDALTAD